MKRAAIIGGLVVLAGLGACSTGLWQLPVVAVMNLVETTDFAVRGDRLVMNGEINSKTLAQFEAIMAEHPQITTLREVDVPGSLDDETMIALAYRVRELGLNTELIATSSIHSGGVDLFLAGVERRAEAGAEIGVHSWADGLREATDYPRDAQEHDMNRTYIEAMLGDDAFYWFTIEAAPAAGIHIMNAQELERYGVLTTSLLEPGTLQ